MTSTMIYVDGSCLGNPGPGGWAAILSFDESWSCVSGYEDHTSNNRMELMAVIMGIDAAVFAGIENITLVSDSAYVVNSINMGYVDQWKARGWKTKAGSDVLNLDLWKQLHERLHNGKANITLTKVKGHSGVTFNEVADKAAKEAAQAGKSTKQYLGGLGNDMYERVLLKGVQRQKSKGSLHEGM